MRKEKLLELKHLMESLKVLKLQKMDEVGSFIKSDLYRCILNNGKTIKREKITKGGNSGSASIILPIINKNQVILTVEPRVFTKKTVEVGIPAGYIEKNETAYDSALRELKEEIGYTTEKLIPLGGFYQDMGCSAAYNESFIAFNCHKISKQNLDEGEYIKYFNCYYDEALELIDMGYIEGCNAIITLERAKKYMKGKK